MITSRLVFFYPPSPNFAGGGRQGVGAVAEAHALGYRSLVKNDLFIFLLFFLLKTNACMPLLTDRFSCTVLI